MDILNHTNVSSEIESVLNSTSEMFTNNNMMNNYSYQDLPVMPRQGTIYPLIVEETKYNVEKYHSVDHGLNMFKNVIKTEPNCLDFAEAPLNTEITYKTTDERFVCLFDTVLLTRNLIIC